METPTHQTVAGPALASGTESRLFDLTEEARAFGLPVPVTMTAEVYALAVVAPPYKSTDTTVQERRLAIVAGLVRAMTGRGLRMNGSMTYEAVLLRKPYVKRTKLTALLSADERGQQRITICPARHIN